MTSFSKEKSEKKNEKNEACIIELLINGNTRGFGLDTREVGAVSFPDNYIVS